MPLPQDQRGEERIPLETPVLLAAGTGVTRGFSRSGLCFLIEQPLPPGARSTLRYNSIMPALACRLNLNDGEKYCVSKQPEQSSGWPPASASAGAPINLFETSRQRADLASRLQLT